ncbi:hypothetical protein V8Z80_18830 [Orrella sp. JC864]
MAYTLLTAFAGETMRIAIDTLGPLNRFIEQRVPRRPQPPIASSRR